MAALSSPPTAEQQQQAMETSRALESLSTSLRQLREHHNASLVPFEEPAARVFARLALSSTINWANVSLLRCSLLSLPHPFSEGTHLARSSRERVR